MSEISKVAFLGTGLMGFPMARNLSANGITPERLEQIC